MTQSIEALQTRIKDLETQVLTPSLQQEMLEELHISLEELLVAEEELHLQNQSLAKARDTVETERKRYKHLFELAPFGYVVTDLNGVIREANEAAALFLQVREDYLPGKPLSVFIQHEDMKIFRNAVEGLRRGNEIRALEIGVKRRDGSTRLAMLDAKMEGELGKEFATVRWAVSDITERKKIEEMKKDFVKLVSHQLKTPVAQIRGFVENMLTERTGSLEQKQRKYLEEILSICIQSGDLISNLLSISRLDQGIMPVHLGPISIKEIVDRALRSYRQPIFEKGLNLVVKEESADLRVMADPSLIVETLKIIVENAIKATERGEILILIKEEDGFGIVEVTDTGNGIPADVLPKLFNKDLILGESPKPNGRSGLGLYMAKGFMTLQNGDIYVDSKENVGSAFTLKIPKVERIPTEVKQ